MFRVHRSYFLFKVFAISSGAMILLASAFGVYEGIAEGMDTTGWVMNVGMAIFGVAFMVGGIYIHKVTGNENAGKKDESIHVSYDITYQGNTQQLEDLSILKEYMRTLLPGEEILIRLTPEYFGLADWKFIKIKNQYFSFVQVRKKDKIIQYFTMPRPDADDAIASFAEVFEGRKAVDTSELISMKRYQAVLEVYKLK